MRSAAMCANDKKSVHIPFIRFLEGIIGGAIALAAAVFIGLPNTLTSEDVPSELTRFYHAFLINIAFVIVAATFMALFLQFLRYREAKATWDWLICLVPLAFGVWAVLTVLVGTDQMVPWGEFETSAEATGTVLGGQTASFRGFGGPGRP